MSGAVHRYSFHDACLCHHLIYIISKVAVCDGAKNPFVPLLLIAAENLLWDFHQFHLIGYLCLVALGYNPHGFAYFHNVRGTKFADVDERKSRECGEDENITGKTEGSSLEMVGQQPTQFFLGEILARSDLLGNMETCKGIPYFT